MHVRVSDLGSPAEAPAFVQPSERKRIGLVLLETDLTIERDFARLCPGLDVDTYATRVPYDNPDTPQALAALEAHVADGAARLLPNIPVDVVHFGCTSASAVIGDAGVAAAVRATKPEAAVINPVLAAVAAFQALGVRRLSILAPYLPDISRAVADTFAARGMKIDALSCWGLRDDRDMGRVRPEVIAAEAEPSLHPDSDALFISCTAVRAVEAAEAIEAATGRPMVSSNQAALWLSLRLCGITDPLPGLGRLGTLPAPEGLVP
jgi:maleate isomerase